MDQVSHDNEPDSLVRLKSSIKKLLEFQTRLANLMMKKFAARITGSSLAGAMEAAEIKVETFAKVLSKFVRLRKKLHRRLNILGNTLRNLEKAESVGEISTLIGLTVLSDHKEYNEAASELMESYETELLPIVPELTSLLGVGAQASEAGKMMNRLLNYDPDTREDDFMRMMTALRDLDIDKFNEIYERMKQRIEIEERH